MKKILTITFAVLIGLVLLAGCGGYGKEVAGFDLGVSLIRSSKELSQNVDADFNPTEDTFFVFSISKSFALMD